MFNFQITCESDVHDSNPLNREFESLKLKI